MSALRTSYLIAANQRSGTTMLCLALADTGVAGRPEEYFLAVDEATQPGWRCWELGPFGVAHGARDREHYLAIVQRLGTTNNGVFGAKLMWNNVRWAMAKFHELPRFAGLDRAEVFRAAFPGLRVIHLTRRDRARQAVSWARAAQDGIWQVRDDQPVVPLGQPTYDGQFIANLERLIVEGEAGWRQLCRDLELTPYEVVYEDLASPEGYERSVRGVLAHLGLDDAVASVPPPRTRRQADELNEAWLARYRSERH